MRLGDSPRPPPEWILDFFFGGFLAIFHDTLCSVLADHVIITLMSNIYNLGCFSRSTCQSGAGDWPLFRR